MAGVDQGHARQVAHIAQVKVVIRTGQLKSTVLGTQTKGAFLSTPHNYELMSMFV